jgi:cystathionine gamma-lyase/cystathionine beta-lyase
LEKNIAALENAKYGLCFSSGMGASDAVIKLLRPGDEVIAGNDLYGGTYRMFTKVFAHFGIKFHFINMHDANNISNYINKNTKMLWVETPTNPTMQIVDLKACGDIARKNNLLLVVDNTFASPFLQNPIDFGAHIVLHSVTKYIGGHSDVVMGALCMNDDKIYEQLAFIHNSCGATPGPMDSFLVLRGIKTLHIRMERHCSNGRAVAEYLRKHPMIDKLYWPGFTDFPNHDIAKKQMRDFGGMISFTLKDASLEETFAMASRMKVFSLAESLGGVESLINHPATMTHASIPKEERDKAGVTDSLLRISVGIEDVEDLIEDLKQAIGQTVKATAVV